MNYDFLNQINFLQYLSTLDYYGADKLYICGSPPAVLSRNYFDRKVCLVSDDYYPVFFLDDIIEHDKRDNRIVLSRSLVIRKESYWEDIINCCDNQELKPLPFFQDILRSIGNNSNDWYDIVVNIIKELAFISKRNLKIEEWKSLSLNEKKTILDFLMSISRDYILIDITKCPKCSKYHIGGFLLNDNYCVTPCGRINVYDLLYNGSFRIKKGFLQFVPIVLNRGRVLVSKKFYYTNINLIKNLSFEDKFFTPDDNIASNKYILENLNEYSKHLGNNRIIINVEKTNNWWIVNGSFGRNVSMLVLLRHLFKKIADYRTSDELRQIMLESYSVYIDDLGEEKYALSIR